jgi:hypothetical protein
MSDLSSASSAGHPAGSGPARRHVQRVAARGQWLVDTPRPADGHDLRWHVEAFYVGDITALAAAALQKRRGA